MKCSFDGEGAPIFGTVSEILAAAGQWYEREKNNGRELCCISIETDTPRALDIIAHLWTHTYSISWRVFGGDDELEDDATEVYEFATFQDFLAEVAKIARKLAQEEKGTGGCI